MAAWPKISRGVFSKNFRPGGYTKNTPLPPLFPLPASIYTDLSQRFENV